jgi:hypothetical protein
MATDKHISGRTSPRQDQTADATQSSAESWTDRSTAVLEKLKRARGAIAVFSSTAKMSWDGTRIGLEHASHHLQLMAANIQSELEEAGHFWDSIERPPRGGTELGVFAAERFMASIEGILWLDIESAQSHPLPGFADLGYAADIAREQLDSAIQALSAAIKLGPPTSDINHVTAPKLTPPVLNGPVVTANAGKKTQAPTVSKPLAMEV